MDYRTQLGGSVYSGTEYDDMRVGEWRAVRSYCARRHTWVVDYAAPILASAADGVAGGDELLQPEKLPGKHRGRDEYASTMARRHADREERITAVIEATGGPIRLRVACKVAGCGDQALRRTLDVSGTLHLLTAADTTCYVGLPHHTVRDLPLTKQQQRFVDTLRALGEATESEIIAALGLSRNVMHRYMQFVDYEVQKRHNGRQIYTVRLYRLKAQWEG